MNDDHAWAASACYSCGHDRDMHAYICYINMMFTFSIGRTSTRVAIDVDVTYTYIPAAVFTCMIPTNVHDMWLDQKKA
jgi:hypothetical protein